MVWRSLAEQSLWTTQRGGDPIEGTAARSLRALLDLAGRTFMPRPVEERTARSVLRALPFDCIGLALDNNVVLAGTSEVSAIFDGEAGKGTPTQRLLSGIARTDARLAASIETMVTKGTAFRQRTTLNGKHLEALGLPHGAFCVLSFRDLARDGALADVEALRAERDALRSVVERHGLPVSIEDETGQCTWATQAVSAGGVSDAQAHAIALPDGRRLRHGGVTAAGDPEAIMRHFVETVRETFACLRVGLAIFDRDRRLMLSNPAFKALFNAKGVWLSGRPTLREILDRLREARQVPEQADFPAWRARLFAIFEEEDSAYEDVWDLPDGRSLQVVATPHPMGGLVFVFEDITEALAMQRWQSTAVEVRRATFDQMAEGVLVIGPDGRLRIANPAFAAQWALTGTDLEGLHIAELAESCAPRCRDDEADNLWTRVHNHVGASGDRRSWEAPVYLHNGTCLKARTAPMPDGSTLVVLTDITDNERIAAALEDRANAMEAAEKMRDAVVEHLSHRLRTPLNAITGFAEVLRYGKEGALNNTQLDYVARIQEGARQVLDTIEDLTDLASMSIDNDGDAGAVALGGALRGAIGLLARRAEDAEVELGLAVQPTEVVVWGHPVRIRETVYRLLSEAIDLAPCCTALRAGAESDGEHVIVWCSGFETPPPQPRRADVSCEQDETGRPRLVSRLPVRGDATSTAARAR